MPRHLPHRPRDSGSGTTLPLADKSEWTGPRDLQKVFDMGRPKAFNVCNAIHHIYISCAIRVHLLHRLLGALRERQFAPRGIQQRCPVPNPGAGPVSLELNQVGSGGPPTGPHFIQDTAREMVDKARNLSKRLLPQTARSRQRRQAPPHGAAQGPHESRHKSLAALDAACRGSSSAPRLPRGRETPWHPRVA